MLAAPAMLAGCGGSSPEGAVNKYLGAWQAMDWNAYKASVLPGNAKLTRDQEELAKQKFEQIKVKLDGIKMKTEYDKKDKNKAVVNLTDGTITYKATILGKPKEEPQPISKMPKESRPAFDVVKVNGIWYVDMKLG